ncbi:nuclear transport factor 2 family protein [Brevibacillus sp. M2.1A]|uniref:YybH family protein n=1 Tax=Brevibacillus TaxID=55080 RepID=UPI0006FC08CB|nr:MULTISPECIES: nuclear transport factor 2 family protein [Brevibacillus]MBY0086556.1 nuclear transport factor 2 family protein [Brevibacillus brevis]MCC8437624.1 nuclear transport factor 2 family protein [Brevibacillus sp. M2.1A]MCE0453731.1 nuclear transport factor 2 family protein [Brevibacillus sp. AF8]MCM3142818.1 nuclear transport factor 2 family protein [Brevibacillus sp. MER 51]RAT96562.1 nuclear transport factor 2 family protein [Brevibacillus sp. Leaf182]
MEEYKRALAQYIDATNTHDFANVEKVLHPNAIYWFSDKTCTSMSEIRAYFENAWHLIKDEVYAATDVQWIAVDQRSASCVYTYQYQGYYNGEFVKGSGRATNIFTKTETDEWKLIHEHLSGKVE